MERIQKRWGKNRLLSLMMAILIPLHLPQSAKAAEPLEQVKKILNAVSAILSDPGLQGPEKESERKQKVRRVIYEAFDFEEMAKESLGTHWSKLTPQQRKEFVELFGDLFERSYNRLVLKFLPERETVYGTETVEKGRALVKTTLVSKKNEQLPVDYRLISNGSTWEFFDVVVDEVSLATNYRTKFNKIIRTSSYESLVRKMKLKQEEESF